MSGDVPAVELAAEQRARLSRREWAGVVVMSVVRVALGAAIIIFCLSLVPESPSPSLLLPVGIVAATVALYLWFSSRQVRRVKRSRFPTVRAIEALILIAVMFLALFAGVYVMLSASDPMAFTEQLDHFTAFYFALTVLATVGFGDITPVSDLARLICMIQMAIDIVFIGILVKVLGGAAKQGLQSRQAKAPDAS